MLAIFGEVALLSTKEIIVSLLGCDWDDVLVWAKASVWWGEWLEVWGGNYYWSSISS